MMGKNIEIVFGCGCTFRCNSYIPHSGIVMQNSNCGKSHMERGYALVEIMSDLKVIKLVIMK